MLEQPGRIVIDDIRPRAPRRHPAKAVVSEAVRVSADIYKDGHDVLAAQVHFSAPDAKWTTSALSEVGNDRWEGVIEPTALGRHELVVEAWTDVYATWRHKVDVKMAAGQDVRVELEEAASLFEARRQDGDEHEGKLVAEVVRSLRDQGASPSDRLSPALDPAAGELLSGPSVAADRTRSESLPLWIDRERALVGAWYELFPRSYGGFAGTTRRLDAVAAMGFDVVYLPPVHPIGRQYRKGPGNTLAAGPDDVGSPWAIGGPEGGHTAVHPDLGTIEDFDRMLDRARQLSMEVALDYALQCSPDHPWVSEHPEWFHHRPDGSIAYAENPPKKYQDIYPINFWPEDDDDRVALWTECKGILDFWIDRGVLIFRVDNPHTKPIALWEWLIPAIQEEHPEVVFLAEAFTRPKMMAKLAEVGFSQSYTYFTWRNSKPELEEYLVELARGPTADYMRPSFWPNTPDILSGPLRGGPPAAFKQRLVLAATMAPSYGIYSGYELCENQALSEDNEEYRHSEKYEVKSREWGQSHSLAPFITRLNDARHRHPALHRLRTIRFQDADNPAVIAYSKHSDDRSDVVLVVVSLDPHNVQECTLTLDLDNLGIGWDEPFEAYDELAQESFTWHGARPYVRLAPDQAAHVLHLRSNLSGPRT
ncbi:MAG: alpha-1,4-glucan--maltose-1-phosphate maltosyltransferase [Actinomycetota bacterium]|nr:alpha-1,4-glucan--maltose-1-phosphate maltosyltransferase [Actinomycetota bacterium]MDQ3573496.1 alpha-1,4-glucan--maltose-1-phosphate maltosyltransferase [Actinomycetota bacterium]